MEKVGAVMNKYMELALSEARKAFDMGEVPVGAVIVRNGEVICAVHNLSESLNDATAHAELLAIKDACKKLHSKYLTNCEMYVTLEPCAMCTGAIINSRIKRLYIGAPDKKTGACGSRVDIITPKYFNHMPEVYHGIMEDDCSAIVTKFFENLRKK